MGRIPEDSQVSVHSLKMVIALRQIPSQREGRDVSFTVVRSQHALASAAHQLSIDEQIVSRHPRCCKAEIVNFVEISLRNFVTKLSFSRVVEFKDIAAPVFTHVVAAHMRYRSHTFQRETGQRLVACNSDHFLQVCTEGMS